MSFPNFLIIGAAKSGTSSLYRYLVQHPDVSGPELKEPSFFAFEGHRPSFSGPGDEVFTRSIVVDIDEYRRLFPGVGSATAVGEASVVYLYSKIAPQRIKYYAPDVKLIALLRDPVDRAVSSFSHLTRDGRESITSFAEALAAEPDRIASAWEHQWHYTKLGYYYEQLSRYYKCFDKRQIRVFTYDEFVADPHDVVRSIFQFLDVDDSFLPDFSYKHNVSGVPKSRYLHNLMLSEGLLKTGLKKILPKDFRLELRRRVGKVNLRKTTVRVDDATREYLRGLFRDDIQRLEQLIERDLTSWHR